jgi:hypothetical protein
LAADIWQPGKPTKVFEQLIYDLIRSHGCTVTYENQRGEFTVGADKHRGRVVLYYTDQGNEFPIEVKGDQDDPTDDKVVMAVPARRVRHNDTYLANAVAKLEDTSISQATRQAFLLGMLLLKRCR